MAKGTRLLGLWLTLVAMALVACGRAEEPQAPAAQPEAQPAAQVTAATDGATPTAAPEAAAMTPTAAATLAAATLAAATLAPDPAATPAPTDEAAPTALPVPTLRPGLAITPEGATAAAVPPASGNAGEVPQDLLGAMVADLAQRLSVDPTAVAVVTGEAITWPDGAMGCPQPGMVYQQVLIDGYKVVLAVGADEYAYHAAAAGDFLLCERRRP